MKPICIPCQRFFRCKQTGFYFTEGMPVVPHALSGTASPESWKPYKAWSGDLFECQGCKAQIVVGVASQPIAEHFKPDFAEQSKSLGCDKYQVNDC